MPTEPGLSCVKLRSVSLHAVAGTVPSAMSVLDSGASPAFAITHVAVSAITVASVAGALLMIVAGVGSPSTLDSSTVPIESLDWSLDVVGIRTTFIHAAG